MFQNIYALDTHHFEEKHLSSSTVHTPPLFHSPIYHLYPMPSSILNTYLGPMSQKIQLKGQFLMQWSIKPSRLLKAIGAVLQTYLFNWASYRVPYEGFSHADVNARRAFVHKHQQLSIYTYSFSQQNALQQRRVNEFVQSSTRLQRIRPSVLFFESRMLHSLRHSAPSYNNCPLRRTCRRFF